MENANPKGIDEVQMSWNVWPWMKVEVSKCVIPLAATISPIRLHPDIPYALLRYKTCASVLKPYACVIFATKICPFCYQRNHFPPHHSMISDTNLLGELYAQHTRDQYILLSFCFRARYLHDRGGDGPCQISFEACSVPLACCPRTPLLATFHLGPRFKFMNWSSPTCSRFWFLR